VVTTGPFQEPYVPKVAESLADEVFQTHAVGYRRPDDVPPGRVLVVGGGNTGFQIAKELSTTHKVVLSIGSRQKPLPQRVLGRDLFWWLAKARILDKNVESRLGRKLSTRDTLIGSSPRELEKGYGVDLKPRLGDTDGRRCASKMAATSKSTPSSGRRATAPITPGSSCRSSTKTPAAAPRGVTEVPGSTSSASPGVHAARR
jgi:putative flavoprotein involved in K+ transport